MRRVRLGIAGTVLATAVVGCSEPAAQDQAVPVPRTNAEQFNSLKNQMEKSIKSDAYKKKPEEGQAEEAKPAATKPAETKPAAAPAAKTPEPKPATPPPVDAKTPEKKP